MSTTSPTQPVPAGQPAGGNVTPQPSLSPGESPSGQRTYMKEPANGAEPPVDSSNGFEYNDTDENSTYLQPPQLFRPEDRSAQRPTQPVWKAIYHKPASAGSAQDQLHADAVGWTSASR